MTSVFILSMHESGSQVLAQLVNQMFDQFFPNEMQAVQEEGGLGDVSNLNDKILNSQNATWHQNIGDFYENIIECDDFFQNKIRQKIEQLNKSSFVLSDPRLCLLGKHWIQHAHQPFVVHLIRDPLSTVASLVEKEGFSVEKSLALWEFYNLSAVKISQNFPSVTIAYEDLVSDGAREFDKIQNLLFGNIQELKGHELNVEVSDIYLKQTKYEVNGCDKYIDLYEEIKNNKFFDKREISQVSLGVLFNDFYDNIRNNNKYYMSEKGLNSDDFEKDIIKNNYLIKSENNEINDKNIKINNKFDSLNSKIAQIEESLSHNGLHINHLNRKIYNLLYSKYKLRSFLFWIYSYVKNYKIVLKTKKSSEHEIIHKSNFFDVEWYLSQNPDVKNAGIDAIDHYLKNGAAEGREPNPEFKTLSYLQNYEVVARLGINPLTHYILYGHKKGYLPEVQSYEMWLSERRFAISKKFKLKKFMSSLQRQPLVSIIMPLYNSNEKCLREAFMSVKSQYYPNWELCLVDDGSKVDLAPIVEDVFKGDPRVNFYKRSVNGGISAATNDALDRVTGEYTCFLDHDDLLEHHAIASMVHAINKNPDAVWYYSDEDKVSENGTFYGPIFKPSWSPAFFLSCMYTCHFSMYKTDVIKAVGGFNSEFDGAQDYEMALRIWKTDPVVEHVPDMLYHWRAIEGSTAYDLNEKPKALLRQIKALNTHMSNRDGFVEDSPIFGMHKAQFKIKGAPEVSIVIPSAGRKSHVHTHTTYIEHFVDSIISKTSYKNYKIYVSLNDDAGNDLIKRLEQKNCIIVKYKEEKFNLSNKINQLVDAIESEYALLLNDDMEIKSSQWLEQMLMWIQQEDIGCVGAKLLFPDDTIQHAGVIFYSVGPGHPYYSEPNGSTGFLGSAQLAREYSAVTGACMMFRKTDFQKVGGYDPEFHLNYNDVDFCWKLRTELGYRIIYTPEAELYHYESVSKTGTGADELKAIRSKWQNTFEYDPYFSRYLHSGTYEVSKKSRLQFEDIINSV